MLKSLNVSIVGKSMKIQGNLLTHVDGVVTKWRNVCDFYIKVSNWAQISQTSL